MEPTVHRSVYKHDAGEKRRFDDVLAVEEPCEIRLDGDAIAVTMRTPGNDLELAAGFLVTEGIVGSRDLGTISHCDADDALHAENVVEARLCPGLRPRRNLRRNFYAASSCGICGKASIESIHVDAPAIADDATVGAAALFAMAEQLADRQAVFAATGGLHAAAVFAPAGELIALREDVGRHNAVDKAIGYTVLADRFPLGGCVLLVSGRTSFEIIQKALVARIPIVAGVSAASSLAVEFAARSNMTLIGFLRRRTFNIYSGAQRVCREP